MSGSVLEKALRHDRYAVVAALLAITALAWIYLLWLAADMEMPGMDAAACVDFGGHWLCVAESAAMTDVRILCEPFN